MVIIQYLHRPSLPPPSHLPLHCDCHCYWYATQPSHLVSQATATPTWGHTRAETQTIRDYAKQIRSTRPSAVCLAFLSVRKQGGAWAQGKCVTLTECTLRYTHIYYISIIITHSWTWSCSHMYTIYIYILYIIIIYLSIHLLFNITVHHSSAFIEPLRRFTKLGAVHAQLIAKPEDREPLVIYSRARN